MKAGAVDFLSKPFRDEDLLDAVTVAVERHVIRRHAAADIAALKGRYATLSPEKRKWSHSSRQVSYTSKWHSNCV
jgi:FixJ family two-component response regulator